MAEESREGFPSLAVRRAEDIAVSEALTTLRIENLAKLGSNEVAKVIEGIKTLVGLERWVARNYFRKPMTKSKEEAFAFDMVNFIAASREKPTEETPAWTKEQQDSFLELAKEANLIPSTGVKK